MARWARFHDPSTLIWLDDIDGTPRALTRTQLRVLELALDMIEGQFMTMRAMAEELRVAPSTVSRALTKLQAWGLLAVEVGRGRWAGLVIRRRAKNDGLDAFRKRAKERIRRWYETSKMRVSRLAFNVASRNPRREGDPILVTRIMEASYLYMGATLNAPWTMEELEDSLK